MDIILCCSAANRTLTAMTKKSSEPERLLSPEPSVSRSYSSMLRSPLQKLNTLNDVEPIIEQITEPFRLRSYLTLRILRLPLLDQSANQWHPRCLRLLVLQLLQQECVPKRGLRFPELIREHPKNDSYL